MHARLIVPSLLVVLAGFASAESAEPAAANAATVATPAPAAPATQPAAADEAAAPASAVKVAAAPQQRCHKEYPTGSNLPRTVCTTAPDPDADRARDRALDDLQHAVHPSYRGVGAGGN
jgi:hypothetical protein